MPFADVETQRAYERNRWRSRRDSNPERLREVSRRSSRAYRRRQKRVAEMLPAAPLRDALEHFARRFGGVTDQDNHTRTQARDNGGMERLARAFADRYELSEPTAWRRLRAIRTAEMIPWWLVDEVCVLGGIHPRMLYGSEWEAVGSSDR